MKGCIFFGQAPQTLGCQNEEFTSLSNKDKINFLFCCKISEFLDKNTIIQINNIRNYYDCRPKSATFINIS